MALHSDKINSLGIRKGGKVAFLHRIYENRRFLGVIPYLKQVHARAFYVSAPGDMVDQAVYRQHVQENRSDWNHGFMGRKPADERMLTLSQAMGKELV